MPGPWYVRSTDGSDASDGLSWANAKATLAGAATAASAGDTIYVSQAHAETQATAMTVTFAGASVTYNRVLCVNDGAEPPTALATTATISTTGSNAITITGSAYVYGITINCGTSTGTASLNLGHTNGANAQWWDTCALVLNGGSSTRLNVSGRVMSWKNTTWKFGHANQFIVWAGTANFSVEGGGVAAGSTATSALHVTASMVVASYKGSDLSNIGTSTNLANSSVGAGLYQFINCRLPASWSGTGFSAPTTVNGNRLALHNSDSADTQYRTLVQDSYGTLTHETTLVRTGGASNGTTPISWNVVSTTLAEFNFPFRSDEIVRWNETTGSALTATVEILRDSATNLTDAEIWLEVMYLGTSGVPLGTWTSDRAADILATPADQTDSSATWTTTGMSNPNTQKLSVTFTPQEKGYVHARVVVAKASTTVYVDPVLTLA